MLKTKEKFVEENIPLVHSLCRRFTGRGIEYEELFGAGCEGLCKAAQKFDQSKGFCFSTYAVPVILGEIRRLFRDGGSVKVSRSVKELYLKITRVKPKLGEKLNREPTLSELAESLGVGTEEITEALCAASPVLSLTYGEGSEISEYDLPVLDESEKLLGRIVLKTALENLNGEEKNIIKLRYFKGLTQSETAKILGMTQVQISRNEKKILLKLRESIS